MSHIYLIMWQYSDNATQETQATISTPTLHLVCFHIMNHSFASSCFAEDTDDLSTMIPPTPKPASLPNAESAAVRQRSALVLHGIQKRARMLAAREYSKRGEGKLRAEKKSECAKDKRNRSAFISRQSMRHYSVMLADHVKRAEQERDTKAKIVADSERDVKALRAKAAALTAKLANLSSSQLPTECNTKPVNTISSSEPVDNNYLKSTKFAHANRYLDHFTLFEEFCKEEGLKLTVPTGAQFNKLSMARTPSPNFNGILNNLEQALGIQSWSC